MPKHLKTDFRNENKVFSWPSLILMTLIFILMMDKYLDQMMYKYKLNYAYESLIKDKNSLDKSLSNLNVKLNHLSDPSQFKENLDGKLSHTDSRDRLLVKRLSDWHFP
ncbi:MAG: hypothetical protein CMF41_00710 [Legionellales bacterium]|nr:hypothetical protein [Legionellales bacterium]